MTFQIPCAGCSATLAVPEDAAGKHARCPSCGQLTLVPADSAETGGDADRWGFLNQPAAGNAVAGLENASLQNRSLATDANPFADADARGSEQFASYHGGKDGEVNPYAPPASADYGLKRSKPSDLDRPGLPWEIEPSVGAWWDTIKLVCSETNTAFRRMRVTGGYGNPTTFGMASVGATLTIQVAWQTMLRAARGGPDAGELIAWSVCVVVASALLAPTIGWHISAALVHFFLSLAGGCNRGYETTFRAIAYSTGGSILIQAIPCAGGLIYLIIGLYVNVIAVKCAHETTGGKAAFAVLAPFFLFVALGIGIGVWIVSMNFHRP